MFASKNTYLDYAALTPWGKGLLSYYKRLNKKYWQNPDAQYHWGYKVHELLEESRKEIAGVLAAHADEIVYTSGGTEGNNLAIKGVVDAWKKKNPGKTAHVITTPIEHSSVKEVIASLEVKVSEMSVNEQGLVDAEQLRKLITPETVLVSVGYVNNEIGTLQPITDIAKQVRWARSHVTKSAYPYFHTDAAQAPLVAPLSIVSLGVDLLSLDGSKFYGPRPAGVLYIKREVDLIAQSIGGGQEEGRRSGTMHVPMAVVFAKALTAAAVTQSVFISHVREMRELVRTQLQEAKINFHEHAADVAVPHIMSLAITDVDAEWLQQQLAAKHIFVSTKSTCLGDDTDSYVLTAIKTPYTHQTIRVSFGHNTSKKDVKRLVQEIAHAIRVQQKAKAFDQRPV